MQKITLKINGMMCGMCEAHINDAIRKAFPVKKVSSSHTKGRMEILTEADIPENDLRAVIDQTGYQVLSVSKETYRKKGFFHRG